MREKGSSRFVVIVGIIIAFGRILLGGIDELPEMAMLIIMALVNYIALSFVLLYLCIDISNVCQKKTEKSGLATQEKNRILAINKVVSGILLLTCLVLGICYVLFFISGTMNDAISILALAVSIASNELAEFLGSRYYKVLVKIAKWKKKKK